MSATLSIQESEFILDNFRELVDGEHSFLAQALRDIEATVISTSQTTPPVLPSQVKSAIEAVGRTAKKSVGFVVSVSSALLASSLAAAALSGVGPKPVVHFAKSTVKNIETLTKKVINDLVVNPFTNDTPAITTPAATPAPTPAPSQNVVDNRTTPPVTHTTNSPSSMPTGSDVKESQSASAEPSNTPSSEASHTESAKPLPSGSASETKSGTPSPSTSHESPSASPTTSSTSESHSPTPMPSPTPSSTSSSAIPEQSATPSHETNSVPKSGETQPTSKPSS